MTIRGRELLRILPQESELKVALGECFQTLSFLHASLLTDSALT